MGGVGMLPTPTPAGRGAPPAATAPPATTSAPKLFAYVLDGSGPQTR